MCFEDKKNAFNVCYFMIKPRVWAGSPPSEGGHRAEATLSCQTLPEWLPTSDMSLPVECLTPMKQGTRKSGRKAVLKNRASTCTVHLSPDLFLSQMPCLSIHIRRKFPVRKNIYIWRVRNKLERALISIAGAGRGGIIFPTLLLLLVK